MNNSIYPCLWFDTANGKEQLAAPQFYCSIFPNSSITMQSPIVTTFLLNGQKFMALYGGPMYAVTNAVSYFVHDDSEVAIDTYWQKLLDGGKVIMPLNKYPWSEKYGWLQDKFGVSWQIYLGKKTETWQFISPSILFVASQNGNAEAAVHYYTTVFKNSNINGIAKYEANENDTVGNVKHAEFVIDNYKVMCMDSSAPHQFELTPGNSFVIDCTTQTDIDYYWNTFIADGGKASRCGWLADKYGVSWQIIPTILGQLMTDPTKAQRVGQALMQMDKIDIATLQNA